MNYSQTSLIYFIVLLLAGCSGGNSDKLRVSSWVSSPAETQLFKELLKEVRSSNPAIDFVYEPIPGNYSEKIQLMLGTHTAPDIFFLQDMVAPAYMSFDVLEPLDDWMAKSDSFNTADFYLPLLKAFQKDGKQYALPKDFSTYVLFTNQKLFEEAGIDSMPTNWETLVAMATALTKDKDGDGKTDQYGLVIEPSLEMLMLFVYQNGGVFQHPDGSLGIVEQPFIEALEFYHGLYERGIATIPSDVGQGWNGDAFGREKAAMCLSGGWLMPFLANSYPDLAYSISHLPQGKQKATIAFTTGYVMPKNSSHKQEAWQIMSYLAGQQGMRKWTEKGLAMPSRKSVAQQNGFMTHPVYKIFMESAQYAKPFQAQMSERGFIEATSGIQAVFFTGKTPQEAMQEIATSIEKYRLK